MKQYKLRMAVCFMAIGMIFYGCGSVEENVAEENDVIEEAEIAEENGEDLELIEENVVEDAEAQGEGEFAQFISLDLEGNEVTQEILKEAQLTVVNIWGTFCSPCIYEMPYLGELAAEYDSSQVQFIGIVIDVYDESGIAGAVEIVETTAANYVHLLPTEELYTCYLSQVSAVPETIFLDADGNVVESVVGAREKEDWKILIDEVYDGLDIQE